MTNQSSVPKDAEIKVTLGDSDVDSGREVFDLRDTDERSLDIWFCESVRRSSSGVKLELLDRGLIVRLRRKRDDADDVTVKLRRPDPMTLPDAWAADDGRTEFKVEADWARDVHQVSASVVTEAEQGLIGEVQHGPPLPIELYSLAQWHFAAAVSAPAGVDLTSLQPLGPVAAKRWKEAQRPGFGEKVAAEQWTLGDLRFLELSIRVPLSAAQSAQTEFATWVGGHGFDVDALRETKTRLVLEHLVDAL